MKKKYDLPDGHFIAKRPSLRRPRALAAQSALMQSGRAQLINGADGINRRAYKWHLPEDYDARPSRERAEIRSWIMNNVLSGATEYGKFCQLKYQVRYAVRFSDLMPNRARRSYTPKIRREGDPSPSEVVEAPRQLADEMNAYWEFKTTALVPIGFRRSGKWSIGTAHERMLALGRFFGALTADPDSTAAGLGVPLQRLTLALLAVPKLWDWYLDWCVDKRGFHSVTDLNCLVDAITITYPNTGWIRQNSKLAKRLSPIPGILTSRDIKRIRRNWHAACDGACKYAKQRHRDLKRIVRQNRDPFVPIMTALEADSPLAEYRKITDELLRRLPVESKTDLEYAEGIRAYLMLRIGMHSGLRARNMRELMFSGKSEKFRSERVLGFASRGELRWNKGAWEIFIPISAFKNQNSSFFRGKPYKLILPDLAGLYPMIESYLKTHRDILLHGYPDPGHFFVRTVKTNKKLTAFEPANFYMAWRSAVVQYGIYNPYTGRGAIKGLLPHGPHCVRDVIATHILKKTGSYELASYGLQNTARSVQEHYGRFLPLDKTGLASEIMNEVWLEPGDAVLPASEKPLLPFTVPNNEPTGRRRWGKWAM